MALVKEVYNVIARKHNKFNGNNDINFRSVTRKLFYSNLLKQALNSSKSSRLFPDNLVLI